MLPQGRQGRLRLHRGTFSVSLLQHWLILSSVTALVFLLAVLALLKQETETNNKAAKKQRRVKTPLSMSRSSLSAVGLPFGISLT